MYFNAPAVEPSSSTRPNELEFTTEPGLPNKELGPFSENEGKVLHNQPYEEDYKKDARLVSLITTTTLHMKIFEETYFQDFEYRHSLDHEEVQHPVGTLFEGMHLLTKQDVQNALQQYHVSKRANYMTQLSNSTKLIFICNDDSCAC